MNELTLCRSMVKALRDYLPSPAVVIKHADAWTAGIPDVSVSYNLRTTWLEVKVNRIKGRGVQALTIRQMARATKCWYILYRLQPAPIRTYIVAPHHVVEETGEPEGCMARADGISHRLIVDFIRQQHDLPWDRWAVS